jgi:hypothetical protein
MPRRPSLSAPVTARRDTAGMPVESEDTAECLEPERIGKASQHLLGTAVGNDVRRDLACELHHSREEPGGRAARMQRQ